MLPINSLAPGKFEWNFRYLILQIISMIDGWGISCELALRWMSLDLTDDKSTLVQVMAWCHQATSHYLSQCWPRSLSPYSVTRPQSVKFMNTSDVKLLPGEYHKTPLMVSQHWFRMAPSRYLSQCWSSSIETVSAGGRSARPARLGVHPIWWRWHGNTKSHAILPFPQELPKSLSVRLTVTSQHYFRYLVQCLQARSHCLNQCWQTPITLIGVNELKYQ